MCDAAAARGSNHWQQLLLRFAYKNAITTNKLHDKIERTEQTAVRAPDGLLLLMLTRQGFTADRKLRAPLAQHEFVVHA